MNKELFRLSDSEKADAIFGLLNPNFTEEGGWEVKYSICDVYDDYALCMNHETRGFERIPYSKNGDTVAIGEPVAVYIVDITKEEQMALEAIKATSGSFENANNSLSAAAEKEAAFTAEKEALEAQVQELTSEKEAFAAQIAEKDTVLSEKESEISTYQEKISAFEQEKTSFEAEKVEMEQKLSDITNENESLSAFKKAAELEKKEAILSKYESHINEETYSQLKEKIDTFSIEDFKKEVCTAAVESDPSIFEKEAKQTLVYTGNGTETNGAKYISGVERILNKYKNGGNK